MNHLIAKVKEEKGSSYKKLISGKDIYALPAHLENRVKYAPGYKPEEDEWFAIDGFLGKKYCLPILREPFRSTDYPLLKGMQPDRIEYLCAYREDGGRAYYFFQRVLKYCLLTKKSLRLGDEVSLEDTRNSILLNEVPDALYVRSEDRLYFKKLETVAPIFRGIDALYREATGGETKEFLEHGFIETADGYAACKVGKANRRRIAMAIDTLKRFDSGQKKEIFDYTQKYYPALKRQDGKFVVRTEKELMHLLWGIEQRYYTAPVTGEDRVANSVRVLAGEE